MKVLALIPARFASTRFPGKPLAILGGKTMIQRVCEQVEKASLIDHFAVVTDDERIYKHVKSLGYSVYDSDPAHPSGTDRCAEVAPQLPDYKVVVNVQGDEPFILPEQIDSLVSFFIKSEFQIGTLAKRIFKTEKILNPNIVKAVFGKNGRALYFSRSPIPHIRGKKQEDWQENGKFFKHIGLYAFRRKVLNDVSKLPASPLEKSESLEQLRWLENGYSIGIVETTEETIGIDTPQDLEKAEVFLKR